MSQNHGTIRAIDWQEVFPGLIILRALRIALSFRALALSAVAIVGTTAGWILCGDIFQNTSDPHLQQVIESQKVWPWEARIVALRPDALTTVDGWRTQSPLLLAWSQIAAPFEQMYSAELGFTEFVYWLVCALWSLVVWSFFGGAISRLAALRLARPGENVPWKPLAGFVRKHWGSYFAAPLLPLLGTFLLAAFLAVVGVVMRLGGPGILTAAILWPFVLLIGFMMAFLAITLYFSWPLMWGAISAEGTDSFGALSHAYSYTYQRPLQYLLYAVVAAVTGVLGWYLISLFAVAIIELTRWGVSWGSGTAVLDDIMAGREMPSSLGNAGASLILFWLNCLYAIVWAFVFSYLWTATTAIYFLLRHQVDSQEMDEVFMVEESEQHGLPPLQTGPDGVAQVADETVMANEG